MWIFLKTYILLSTVLVFHTILFHYCFSQTRKETSDARINPVSASLTPSQPLYAAPIQQSLQHFTRFIHMTKTAPTLPCFVRVNVWCIISALFIYVWGLTSMHGPSHAGLLHPAAHLQVVHTQYTALESLSLALSA